MLQRIKWIPAAAAALAAAAVLLTLLHVITEGEGIVLVLASITLGAISIGNN